MSPVRVVDVNYVAVPAKAALPPEAVKLNAMEAQWVVLPPLQYILLFEGDQLPPFDAAIPSLRSSLSATLANFAPLAGKLVHLADTGDVAIRCSASDDGVRFVVAESDADFRRLVGEGEHDVQTLEQLVPELDTGVLPAPLMAVQATRLDNGGGVALGVTVHHGVADGRSLWRFVEAWAAACRGTTPPEPPPCFDRSRVKLPNGEELARGVLRKYAPDLPVAAITPSILQEDCPRFIRWTFDLDAQHIERLKQRIVRLGEAHAHGAPSRFVAVVALAWTCFVRCRSVPADEDVFLFFLADVRNRIEPPAGAEYLGACLSGCLAALPARELHGERALAAAAAAAQGAIREMAEDPIAGWEFLRLPAVVPMDRFLNVSGSPSLRAYEAADFGWGRPRRTLPVRMNQDGQVALVRARDGDGVQVSVSVLQRAHMDAFKLQFLELLG